MNKSVLFFLFLCIVISLLFQGLASAEYFNDSWFEQRQKAQRKYYFPDSGKYPPEEKSSEETETEESHFGINLPENITKPVLATSDSIYVDKSLIKRQNEIPGL